MRILKYASLIIVSVLIWTAFIAYGLINGFLLRPITSQDTPEAFITATKDKISDEFVGNFAMALIEDGKVANEHFYGFGEEIINEKSVFPVASISKWVTSVGIMKLVQQGVLDLDKPIDEYLTRWHLPVSDFDNKKVTIRRLLSHSAGLVDDLGYGGFDLDVQVQTIEESLTNAADGYYEGAVARVGIEPSTQYMYSGAGYTILQLLIEEVTGQSFQKYMKKEVLQPLGMKNSTFDLSEMPNLPLVSIYKDDSTVRPGKKFTALAAAALHASTADLSKFLIANVSENDVLSQETINSMSKSEAFINDIGVYGLGPHLYSQSDKNSNIIGHDGSGNNAINTAARIDLKSKNGIIVLETGNHDLASAIADEWMFWKFGIADRVVIERNISYLGLLLVFGYCLIAILSVMLVRKSSRKRGRNSTI
jgi:CubicO group peptidase (beta-lactamase class C family)